MAYPTAPRTDLIETLHGVAVADPFRRLESADDPETVAWVAAQNAGTRRLLDSPLRDVLAARLRELHRVPRASVPAVRGDRIFYHRTRRHARAGGAVSRGGWGLRRCRSSLVLSIRTCSTRAGRPRSRCSSRTRRRSRRLRPVARRQRCAGAADSRRRGRRGAGRSAAVGEVCVDRVVGCGILLHAVSGGRTVLLPDLVSPHRR